MEQTASTIKKGRILSLLLLLFEIGIMFAYGFGSRFFVEPSTIAVTGGNAYLDHADKIVLYSFTGLLAILGFGLLIAYSQNSAVAGLTTTLIVISITVQLGPLILSFWSQVFNGFSSSVWLNLQTERQSMTLCTSLLAALTCLVGRLGPLQTFVTTLVYNVGWALSYKVTQYIYLNKAPTSPSAFDDNGTNYVYVFAGFFALITSIIINCKKGEISQHGSRHSVFIGMIGTGFIFATFPFTGILFSDTAANNIYRRMQSPLNIYFALTASVIVTYIFGALFGKFKIGVRESLIGVISGGVTISVISGVTNNIGACIAIGAFSGLVSGFWLQVIHPRINKTSSIDHTGMLGPILICSVIGGLVLAPSFYQSFYSLGSTNVLLGAPVTNTDIMAFELAYIGIAAGTGIVTALFAGLLSLIFRDETSDNSFTKLVSSDFGLYKEEKTLHNASKKEANQTNAQLNRGGAEI